MLLLRTIRTAALLLSAAFILIGCQSREDATRNEIYKLAFRTSQLQAALERCDTGGADLLSKHASSWQQNFVQAQAWLSISQEIIAGRQTAGREALSADAEIGCEVVLTATQASLAAAGRWAVRISEKRYCGWLDCE